ncbi:Putative multidrug export ATP-binding/permease protein [bacterium HR29]|nr:Putative multidrug export ATP-binding/permease protein [bacterium HR29]
MRYLLRLLPYLKPYRWLFVAGVLCTIASAGLVMLNPLLVGWAIDFGLKPVRNERGIAVDFAGNERLLLLAALAIVLVAIGRGLAAFGQQFLGENIGQRVAYDLRNRIYDNIQRLSFAYHDRVHSGQIMSRATQDVENIRIFFNMGGIRLFYIVLLLFVALGGMFAINWQLALVSIVSFPIIAWRSIVTSRRLRPLWMEIQQNQAMLTQVSEEGLSGIRVVKAFAREEYEAEKFRRVSQRQADLNYTQARIQAFHAPLMNAISMAQIAATVGFGSWLIARGQLAPGALLTFVLWLNLLQLPVRSLGWIINIFARAASAAERVFELIDAESEVKEKPNAIVLRDVKGHVRFENVSFAYNNVSPVLHDITIDAPPGKLIALLGPAGSGKSTIVNLIPRFYDVSAGRITIDGIDIRDVTIESLRKNIGIVQQDVFLFVGTIRDNIAYGRPDATQEEIERVAKAARIHDFIVSLPNGYDEWVGERGVTLSGGQKQRIAIARTLLLDPKILILDDATASVDSQTEFLIQQALHELMTGRTTFVIAQRLRTIMRADEIIVLDRGRIIQRGTHAELIAQEGLYRRIYELELKDQEEALGKVLADERAAGLQRGFRAAPAPGGGS